MQQDVEPLFDRLHTVLQLYPASHPRFLEKLHEQRWTVEAIEILSTDHKSKTIATELRRELEADPPTASAADLHSLTERLARAHEEFSGAIKPALSLASTQAAVTLICTISALFIGNTGIVNFVKQGAVAPQSQALPQGNDKRAIGKYSPAGQSETTDSTEGASVVLGIHVIQVLIIALIIVMQSTRYASPRLLVKVDGELSKATLDQFAEGWLYMWIAWLLLYSWLALVSGLKAFDSDFVLLDRPFWNAFVKAVADVLDGLSATAMFWCYLTLDLPSVKSRADRNRNQPFLKALATVIAVGAFVIVLAAYDRFYPTLQNFGVLLLGLYTGISMAFFVGRFDSHWMNVPRLMLAPLYAYAMLQMVYPFFHIQTMLAAPVYAAALLLKLLLFVVVTDVCRTGDMSRYLTACEDGVIPQVRTSLFAHRR